MGPAEISTLIVGAGTTLVGILTVMLNRRAQNEQRRDQQAAEVFQRIERELERARQDNKDLRDALREQDNLKDLIEHIKDQKEK